MQPALPNNTTARENERLVPSNPLNFEKKESINNRVFVLFHF